MRILDLYIPPDPAGIVSSYLFTIFSYYNREIKWNTADWVRKNIFCQQIFSQSILNIMTIQIADVLYEELDEITEKIDIKCNDIHDILIFVSPNSQIYCIAESGSEVLKRILKINGKNDQFKTLLKALKNDGMEFNKITILHNLMYGFPDPN